MYLQLLTSTKEYNQHQRPRDHDDDDDDDDEYDNFYSAITQHMPLQGRLLKKLVACQRYDFSK